MRLLEKALKSEKKRNTFLSKKLKQVESTENSFFENSPFQSDEDDLQFRHSTLRENQLRMNESTLQTSMNNLSVASLNVSECKSAIGDEEIDKKCFEQWKDLLEASMELIGVADEHIKMNIFRIKAGPKLLDVFSATVNINGMPDPVTSPYSNAIKRLENYFGSRSYILMQRQKLRSLTQHLEEADTTYVKRVITAAKLCDFDEEQLAENVALTIQSHAITSNIRAISRKVLRKGESVAYLLDKVKAVEMEKVNEELYVKNHQNFKQIAAVSFNQNARDSHSHTSRVPFRNQGFLRDVSTTARHNSRARIVSRNEVTRSSTDRKACWRCTSTFHAAPHCHAIEKICRNCQVKGHIERACRSAKTTKRNLPEMKEGPDPKVRRIAAVSQQNFDSDDQEMEVVSDLISE